jgi:hypothetical protein
VVRFYHEPPHRRLTCTRARIGWLASCGSPACHEHNAASKLQSRMSLSTIASAVRKTPSRAVHTALLGSAIMQYWSNYFSHRGFPRDQDFYVVYTSIDHSIPFRPDSAPEYWLVNLRLMPTAVELGDPAIDRSSRAIRNAYVNIAREGGAAFKEVPTIMPRLTAHAAGALHATHTLLRPVNCSPSLHTAAPFFVYNLGARYVPEREPELRQCVGDIVSTVIKSKLHALIDIGFGIFLAQRAITDRLGLDFDDLESFFTRVQKSKDGIPYENVYGIYREITELGKSMVRGHGGLPEIMECYFREIGLPRVRREQSNCYYDLERKALVYAPELQVGKGLF